MAKITQSEEDLKEQLTDQLGLIKTLGELYDSGNRIVAKPIATAVRVLVHDTSKSSSLLKQLNKKNIDFYDTIANEGGAWRNTKALGSHHALVGVGVKKGSYIPYLDESIPGTSGVSSFEDFWNRIILIDSQGNQFSRQEIVLTVANKDGGTHVDPEIDEKYIALARENSMGIKVSSNGKDWNEAEDVVLATIRQIGHEIVRTLDPDYPEQKMQSEGSGIIIGGLRLG